LAGESAPAERLRKALKRAGPKHRAVFLTGEKGSNFILHARAIHAQFPGARHPLLHWEAARQRPSALKRALARLVENKGEEGELLRQGGSLFVEDAQALPAEFQDLLAAALTGEEASRDFRLIVGQTHDPERLIQDEVSPPLRLEGKALTIRLPPLRERRKDIPGLAGAILDEFAGRVGQERRLLTPAAQEWISSQPWWGNEAQLEVALWRAYLLADGSSVSLDDVQPTSGPRRGGGMEDFFRERLASAVASLGDGGESDLYAHTLRSVERPLLELVLRESGGNQLRAARLLGMNRNTFRRRLQDLGLAGRSRGRFRPR
ncbi:MAG: helix-turn-helix domain-containing protein, partial [bacterium]